MQLKLSRKGQFKCVVVLFVVLLVTMIVSMAQGSIQIPVRHVIGIIKSLFSGTLSSEIKETHAFILTEVRMPRIMIAALVGGTLSVIGASFQAIFKNPMADPYIMGVSSGAAFGATVGIVMGISSSYAGMSMTSVLAFAGALTTVFLVYQLARTGTKVSTTGILLAGIVVNAVLTAMMSLLMMIYHSEIDRIVTWTMGSFNAASWEQVKWLIAPVLLGNLFLLSQSRALNAMVIGDDEALNMGVSVERVKKFTLVISSFLAAFAVSVSGIIGFVGLIVPHFFRMLFGSNHKVLIPISFLGGAWFLLLCDTLARSLVPNMEVPVGIITASFGGPFFLFLLHKHKKKWA